MRRIGRPFWLAALLFALPALAATQFYQQADRDQVGLADTFELTIVATNPPANARLQVPDSPDFEILAQSQSTEQSISIGMNGTQVDQTQKYILVMRATRAGRLTIPGARLVAGNRTYRAQPTPMTVRKGHLANPNAYANNAANNPFAALQQMQRRMQQQMQQMMKSGASGFPPDDQDQPDQDEDESAPDVQIPRDDSDLFLRSVLSPATVYVGQQATLSMYIYSRVDLSSVDAVDTPKLDGFWSEDIDSPTQLSGEQKIVNGVPYRVYLLRRKALFPVKPGKITIDPTEADITTGFLFAGRRLHRVGNPLNVLVRPLPPGAPKGFSPSNVGSWKLSAEASADKLELGQPLTVRVTLQGVGNLKNLTPPKLQGPAALKIYDPTTTDKVSVRGGKVGGRRVQEYLVMAQQTGTFTLPSLELPYFDPATGGYQTARTQPITFTVVPGQGGATSLSGPTVASAETGPKNVLAANGIRPLRYQARFVSPSPPIWQARYFIPAVLGPFGAWAALGVFGLLRSRFEPDEEGKKTRRLAKKTRGHLAAAQQLKAGAGEAFWAELERALLGFLSLKLGASVTGLTREALLARLEAASVTPGRREQIRRVLEACEIGRYAPGVDAGERDRALDVAARLIGEWEDR